MIGCFGVAPASGQALSNATSAENGGNMDYRRFGVGTTVWFPVAVTGALFALGDCHAVQGDGEVGGTGIETTFEVEVRLSVEKSRRITWPRGLLGDGGEPLVRSGCALRRGKRLRPRLHNGMSRRKEVAAVVVRF
jgi:acetamidase/formamidase